MIRNIALAAALTFTACAPAHAAEPMTQRELHRNMENALRAEMERQTQHAPDYFVAEFCRVNGELAATVQVAVEELGMIPMLEFADKQEPMPKAVIRHVAMLDFSSARAARSNVETVCADSAQ